MVVFSALTTNAVLTSVQAKGALSVGVCVCVFVVCVRQSISLFVVDWVWTMAVPQSNVADLNKGDFPQCFFLYPTTTSFICAAASSEYTLSQGLSRTPRTRMWSDEATADPPLGWHQPSVFAKFDNTDDGYKVLMLNLHMTNSWNVLMLFLKGCFLMCFFSPDSQRPEWELHSVHPKKSIQRSNRHQKSVSLTLLLLIIYTAELAIWISTWNKSSTVILRAFEVFSSIFDPHDSQTVKNRACVGFIWCEGSS